MKVTGVDTILIRNIEPYIGGQHWLFVQLKTDEGIIGLGERPTMHAVNLQPQISMIEDFCEQFVIGSNPFQIERIWQTIYASRHDWRHPSLYMTPALSAIEWPCGISSARRQISPFTISWADRS